jgi:hypothetical protein
MPAMKNRPALLACLLCLPVASGCVLAETTSGAGLVHAGVDTLEVGISTREDVTRLLGPPDEIIYSNKQLDPLFERAFRYRRTKTRQTALFLLIFSTYRSETRWDHAVVFFDDSGVVEDIGLALDRDKAEYGLSF